MATQPAYDSDPDSSYGGSMMGRDEEESDGDNRSDFDPTKRKKLRRACDYCTKKKVRCDGRNPCDQCQRRKLDCKFSICQRSGPRSFSQLEFIGQLPLSAFKPPPSALGHGGLVQVKSEAQGIESGTELSSGGVTSKADQQFLNYFLSEFNAFVPLTTNNILKDTLQPGGQPSTEHLFVGEDEIKRQSARVAVMKGCSAIGAIIKGQKDVTSYLKAVRDALSQCFDFISFETMCAYMVTAYCHDLLGNAEATRNYMEFAKAVAFQLPQITVDSELVFQFYRVCSEIQNKNLSQSPKLLQQPGSAVPCYQVLNVLTYTLYVLANVAIEEETHGSGREHIKAELTNILPILVRADKMSVETPVFFGALGVMLIKSTLAYTLCRLGHAHDALKVLQPLTALLVTHPGFMRQLICWHFMHCILLMYLEHGCFKEYDTIRHMYNNMLRNNPKSHYFKDAKPYPPVDQLSTVEFMCTNPLCRAIVKDLTIHSTEELDPIPGLLNGNHTPMAKGPACRGPHKLDEQDHGSDSDSDTNLHDADRYLNLEHTQGRGHDHDDFLGPAKMEAATIKVETPRSGGPSQHALANTASHSCPTGSHTALSGAQPKPTSALEASVSEISKLVSRGQNQLSGSGLNALFGDEHMAGPRAGCAMVAMPHSPPRSLQLLAHPLQSS